MMEKRFALLFGVVLLQLLIHCSGADLKVEEGAKTVVDPKVPLTSEGSNSSNDKKVVKNLVSKGNEVQEVKKEKDQDGGSNSGVGKGKEKTASDGKVGSTESVTVAKGEKDSNDGKKGKPTEESKAMTKEDVGNAGHVNPVRDDGTPHGEECGSANMCTVEENKLVACLRVPGDDESPHLSLLIQNKGKEPLVVTISAPDFVRLDKSNVQLKEKDNAKVDVSVGSGGAPSIIVLKAGNGNCSLDFKDLITHSSHKEPDSSSTTDLYLWKHRPAIGILLVALLLILVLAGIYVRFMKKQVSSSGFKYQKLDDEHLPVLSSEKPALDMNDGWDDTWDDKWDDEEAPHTPSMPVTPSLSGKGLASRRLNKEGWKD